MIEIETIVTLTEPQLDAIAALERSVIAADGGRLKLEWGALRSLRPDPKLLAYDGERLVGFCGIYSFGAPTLELTGMVDPGARRQGLGRRLLTSALDAAVALAPARVLLVVPRNRAGGRELAAAHGGRLDHSEHAMALDGSASVPAAHRGPAMRLRAAGTEDLPLLRALLLDGFGEGMDQIADDELGDERSQTWVLTVNGTDVGTLRSTLDGARGAIYGFVVARAQRGRGIGRQALARTCEQLRARGATRIELEVETSNDSALGLYESVGFTRVITEDYYELELPAHQRTLTIAQSALIKRVRVAGA